MLTQRRSGFSLVELLMTIAVIAILAGILLPVFVRSKATARKAACICNLKHLGRAFDLYISDWNGVYPSPGGMPGDHNYWAQTGNDGIVGYVGCNGGLGSVWCCPELTSWQGKYSARTYSMNSYLRNPPDKDYPGCIANREGIHEINILEPTQTILLYEGLPVTPSWPDSLDYIYRCGNWSCVRGWFSKESPCLHTLNSWQPWHGKSNNYLYIDGHVKTRPPGRIVKGSISTMDEMREWWVRKDEMAEKMKGMM